VSPGLSASQGDTLAVMATLVPGRSCGSGFVASIMRVWRGYAATAASICAKLCSTRNRAERDLAQDGPHENLPFGI